MGKAFTIFALAFVGGILTLGYKYEKELRVEHNADQRFIDSVKNMCDYAGSGLVQGRGKYEWVSIYKCQDFFSIVPGKQND